MKKLSPRYQIFAFYVLTFALLAGCATPMPISPFYRYDSVPRLLDSTPYIQVLLTEYDNVDSAMVKIDSAYGVFQYKYDRDNRFIGAQLSSQQIGKSSPRKVYCANGQIIFDGSETDNRDIVLVPMNKANANISKPGREISGRNYSGYLRISALPGNKISLVNIIDLENYLPGVVSSEMDEAWPDSALGAQAITARSFAFYRIKQLTIRKPTKTVSDYDLTDDMYSQVYKGEERVGPRTRQAVDQTKGIILSYSSNIFNCMFHGMCGGATEPGDLVFNLTPIPPLKGRTCGYCANAKKLNWDAEFTEAEIIKALKLEKVKGIEDIQPSKTAPGGHIIELEIKIAGRPEPLLVNAQTFRIALNPNKLRSTLFRIEHLGNTFKFIGKGWGHAVGMCQEGARTMAEQKSSAVQILEFYYPEAKVVKIY